MWALFIARSGWRWPVLLIGLTLIRGLLYGAIIPPWQAPDEPQHFEHARLIWEHGRSISRADLSPALRSEISASMQAHRFWLFAPMPVKPRIAAEVPVALQAYWDASHGEFHQPSLYYRLQAYVLRLFPFQDITLQLYIMRFFSTLLGCGVVGLSYLAVRCAFPEDDFLQRAVPFFIAFLPMRTYLDSTVNNDNLAELCATAALFFITIILRNGLTIGPFLGLSGAILVGLYTKTTTIFVIPIALLTMVVGVWSRIARTGRWILVIGGTLGGMGAGMLLLFQQAGPVQALFLKVPVLRLAQGMPLDWPAMLSVFQERWILYFRSLFIGFWGSYGWYTLQLPRWIYWLWGYVCLLAGLGLVSYLLKKVRSRCVLNDAQSMIVIVYGLAILSVVGLTVIRFLVANVAWAGYGANATTLPQGRFLFVAILPISTLFMIGIRELVPPSLRRLATLIVILTFVVFDLISLVGFVIPFYYGLI